MSTDYNYDEQVRLFLTLRSLCYTNIPAGPILPVFYPNHLRPRHSPLDLFSLEAQQRFEAYAVSKSGLSMSC